MVFLPKVSARGSQSRRADAATERRRTGNGPLRAHMHDTTQTNAWMEAAGQRLVDGLLGAEILRPLSAVIDHAGATLDRRVCRVGELLRVEPAALLGQPGGDVA